MENLGRRDSAMSSARESALSHIARPIRRTVRALDIVEAILNGRYAPAVTRAGVLEPFAVEWETQYW